VLLFLRRSVLLVFRLRSLRIRVGDLLFGSRVA
jgi:hypothetical protein